MRVFLRPTGLHSRAMTRTADALARHAPPSIRPVDALSYTDLQILHVINQDAIPYAREIRERGGKYAVIQYCFRSAGGDLRDWLEMWRDAEVVWSYLWDLKELSRLYPSEWNPPEGWLAVNGKEDFNLYYAPLGVDRAFIDRAAAYDPWNQYTRRARIVTTGYVSGAGAEPIEDVWKAAELAGIEAVHIGPYDVEGMGERPKTWRALQNLTDEQLANVYSASTWVSGLRHVEGFELPAAEGLVCGARPLVFDQACMREWYGGHAGSGGTVWGAHAVFVRESSGNELVRELVQVFNSILPAVAAEEREHALSRFNWETIAKGFWEALLR